MVDEREEYLKAAKEARNEAYAHQDSDKVIAGETYKEAAESFEKAREYEDAAVHYQRSGDFYNEVANQFKERRDSAHEKEYIEKSAKSYLRSGELYQRIGNFQRAGETYKWAGRLYKSLDDIAYYKHVENSFRQSKICYGNWGDYHESGKMYVAEMDNIYLKKQHDLHSKEWTPLPTSFMEIIRKRNTESAQNFKGELYRRVGLAYFWFLKYSCNYGESPLSWLLISIAVMLISAVVYSIGDVSIDWSCWNISFNSPIGPSEGEYTEGFVYKHMINPLYFSLVTFTTLGYGDFKPEPWLRLIASTEALLGAILISGFIVLFSRKLIRR